MVTAFSYAKMAVERLRVNDIPDAAFEVRCLLEDVAHLPYGVAQDAVLSAQTVQALDAALEQRLSGRPLQYILGQWDFLSLRLKVGEGVLIPRADTELLCETAADRLRRVQNPHVLDLCAGSGCVGIGVASLLPCATVVEVEKSPQAFAFLQENIKRYPQYAVRAVQADILTDFDAVDGSFDAILSNPPYIASAELDGLMREVQHEPRLALDGGADGLLFYRAILTHWLEKLKKGGFCAVEIGFDQGEQVNRLFGKFGLKNTRILKDYGGNDRVVIGEK